VNTLIQKVIKDAYRCSPVEILRSSSQEIVKKSKRRTKTLHIKFSIILWSHVLIFYFVTIGLLNTQWILIPPTLLILIFLFFECGVEIYLCRNELAVLNENIDMRRINPEKALEDFDLKNYKKKLMSKITIMSFATFFSIIILVFFMIRCP